MSLFSLFLIFSIFLLFMYCSILSLYPAILICLCSAELLIYLALCRYLNNYICRHYYSYKKQINRNLFMAFFTVEQKREKQTLLLINSLSYK